MLLYLKKHPAVFDPDEVRVLTAAFDRGWQLIEASGAKFESDGHAENVREVSGQAHGRGRQARRA